MSQVEKKKTEGELSQRLMARGFRFTPQREHVYNVLLQKRTDNELWGLPGGAMNIGESVAQAVVREVRE